MQAFVEVPFDLLYLVLVIAAGLWMAAVSRPGSQYRLFGVMAVVLGTGDAFHLVPRVLSLLNGGFDRYTAALGIGKLVTSVTMTVFYLLLYQVWRRRYGIQGEGYLSLGVYLLAGVRIALCLFPQNGWTSSQPPLSWGIWRNIPFALLGLVILLLWRRESKRTGDLQFGRMWLAILLSFGFYIPVVLWAERVPLVGMLMLPKTCAYLWMVSMGWRALRQERAAC